MAYLLNCLEVPKSYLPEVGSLPSGTQVGKDDERMHGIPPMSTFYNDLAGAPKFTLLPCLLLFLRAGGESGAGGQ